MPDELQVLNCGSNRIYSPAFHSNSSDSVLGVNLISAPEFYF